MVDFSFPLEELEYYLLILVRVACFVFSAPIFSMNNTPRNVRIGLSVFISMVLYGVITPHVYPEYSSVLTYAILVLKEAIVGLLVGLGAEFVMMVVTFAGHLVDVEIGFSMASTMDPLTRQTSTVTGFLYQYTFMLIFIISGMYQYLLKALADLFVLIPVGQGIIIINDLYKVFLSFMSEYLMLGFRLALPVVCSILITNGLLGVMAKVSPQMNMFSVGLQIKVLAGLGVLYLTASTLPMASEFLFDQMKIMIVSIVKAMGGVA